MLEQAAIETIAKICHEANRAYCETLKDFSQTSWEMAPQWQKESAIKGVLFHLNTPNSTPADSHTSWLKEKEATGWVYGEVKDPDAKPPTHPCCVPFERLPIAQQMKDFIFHGIVHAMKNGYRLP